MTLQQRIDLLDKLGEYIDENSLEWQQTKDRAASSNAWFATEFIEHASKAISDQYLQRKLLQEWVENYKVPKENEDPKTVGVVMAGNIPLVGFHDMLCVFISGHHQVIKLSSKDDILIKHLVKKMYDWNTEVQNFISFADKLKNCEAYIATGSNNSSRYFDYYFGRYPSIIRRNRTSIAILTGRETTEDLENLANDIQMYFGLGCRNVTKLYVPTCYNFEPLLEALNRFGHFADFHKYRHNYDYQLALLMMGNKMYMTNGTILITENKSLFSAISQVHYETYEDRLMIKNELNINNDIQCIVASDEVPFGQAQHPSLTDYADGEDTMQFLLNLK